MTSSAFTIRPIHIDFDKININSWYGNDPVKTHYYNALSTLFPLGEGFFIWSMAKFRHLAPSALRTQIDDFVKQEGNHSRVHEQYNQKLRLQGYFTEKMDRSLARKINQAKTKLPARICLAATVATEHYTAILGDKVLRGTVMTEAGIDEQMKTLWKWHSIEEVEHKSVAMDLFLIAGGTRRELAITMFFVTLDFWGDSLFRMLYMLQRDKALFRWKSIGSMLSLFFGKKGLVPLLWRDTFRFFRKGFHPNQIENLHLLETPMNVTSQA